MSCRSGAGSAAEAMHDYGQSGVVSGIPVAPGAFSSASFGFMPPHGYMPPMSKVPAAGGYSYPPSSGQYPTQPAPMANGFYNSYSSNSNNNASASGGSATRPVNNAPMPMYANENFNHPYSSYHQYAYPQGGRMMNNYQNYTSRSSNGYPDMRMNSTAGHNGAMNDSFQEQQNETSYSRPVVADQSSTRN
jgi:hypothetical protein